MKAAHVAIAVGGTALAVGGGIFAWQKFSARPTAPATAPQATSAAHYVPAAAPQGAPVVSGGGGATILGIPINEQTINTVGQTVQSIAGLISSFNAK